MPSPTLITELTAKIVTAYVGTQELRPEQVPGLIKSVAETLRGNGPIIEAGERPEPAVSVKKSITPDYLICLEDGRHLKMLKRYLRTTYNLTPDQYREKWGLPADYPMVAPNYAKKRSEMAKRYGLGKK